MSQECRGGKEFLSSVDNSPARSATQASNRLATWLIGALCVYFIGQFYPRQLKVALGCEDWRDLLG